MKLICSLPCHSHMWSLVISIFLYACESWTLTAELEKRTQAFEMRCYRRLLNISYKDHVKKRELRWLGHVSRSSGLAKAILQGTVQGKKKGRQKKRSGQGSMDFASSTMVAEDRTRWEGIVVKSSVVPQRPLKAMG